MQWALLPPINKAPINGPIRVTQYAIADEAMPDLRFPI
jgi:hypothetical protein